MTSVESRILVFEKDLQAKIDKLEEHSDSHKTTFRQQQLLIAVLSAAVTILASAATIWKDQFCGFFVIVISSMSTALSAYFGILKARELWQHERETYYDLVDLKRQFDFYKEDVVLSPKLLESYFNRYQEILALSKKEWSKHTVQIKPILVSTVKANSE